METLNYVFYGSILALVLLQIMMTYWVNKETFVTSSHSKAGCEGQTASLQCPNGQTIIDASLKYGRYSADVCKNKGYLLGKTRPNFRTANLTSRCKGQSNCSVVVNNQTAGGDPYPNVSKHWNINYKCEGPDPAAVARAKVEAEARAKANADRAKAEAEAKAKAAAFAAAAAASAPGDAAAEARARALGAAAAKAEAEAKAQAEAAARAKAEAEAKAPKPVAVAPTPGVVTPTVVATTPILLTSTVSTPAPVSPVAAPVVPSQLPAFMDPNRLLLPFTNDEILQYKVFHITMISCVIKQSLNEKIKNKQVSFKEIYRNALQQMGIEPRIFERNLDGYMKAVQTQSDRTWKEVFDSVPFLNAVTENINYFVQNPSQSKLSANNMPIGTIQHVRKPISNESAFVASYEKCKARVNSLEFASPISFTARLYD